MDEQPDLSSRIEHLLEHLAHILPAQAPLKDFVHHNTLHGFQHRPFREALAAARSATGGQGFLPLSRYRDHFRQGRIDLADLHAALDETPELAENPTLDGRIERRTILLAGLMADFGLPPLATWAWQVEEQGILHRTAPSVPARARERLLDGQDEAQSLDKLWRTCQRILAVPEAPDPLASEAHSIFTPDDGTDASWQRHGLGEAARTRLAELLGSVAAGMTLGGMILRLTGEDVLDEARPYLIRHLAAHLDRGMAAWHNPLCTDGFYAAWLASARQDPHFELHGLTSWQQTLERLPESPVQAILQCLMNLGLEPEHWEVYLESLAKELPGWAGMVLQRGRQQGPATPDAPVAMADYLAVRLVLEQVHGQRLCGLHFKAEASLTGLRGYLRRHPAEFLVRLALYGEALPEWLADQGHRLARAAAQKTAEENDDDWLPVARLVTAWQQAGPADPAAGDRQAWPLYLLCQHLGLNGEALAELGQPGANAMLDCLAELTPERAAWVWLLAFERHYREQVFAALAANHDRGAWRHRPEGAGAPRAQLIFCMDDREEGLRRYLEERCPDIETLGAAAHLGLFIRYTGLGGVTSDDLCPVGTRPSHVIRERPTDHAAAAYRATRARQSWRRTWKQRLFQDSRLDPWRGLLASLAAAPAALAVLAGRMLFPATLADWAGRLRQSVDGRVETRLDWTAPGDAPATPATPRVGYTDAEQADRVHAFLTGIGLTRGFSSLVAIVGHGSNSLNNPHQSAYDCGACSGRHSGPNARLFAAMANRPEVRALVRTLGIDIPASTWFLGCEHNTCDDQFIWFDSGTLPDSHVKAFEALRTDLAQAGALHAQERCRRFISAPLDLDPDRALRHVRTRRNDYGQARPELGHANNAAAYIGRRAATRGIFWDRRMFLISYDCELDPDGRGLEPMLVANGQVGAGISLEYYFSTVDNDRYGSGSKVTHNVTGLMGVMDGASSDLRTGLPAQMIEIHEPMRLLIVVEHDPEVLAAIYARQPVLRQLIGNGWVQLAAKDPDSPALYRFMPDQGWVAWAGTAAAPPRVAHSGDWIRGQREALPPALVEETGPC